ncbi:MAG: hypothetical protein LBJ22_04605, partial [Synergistaceae bacterium]|nr:hypothetical protein [Synergistaceae bacterium]
QLDSSARTISAPETLASKTLVPETFASKTLVPETLAPETLNVLKNAISNWEGVLKADGHAQTRELSEFSSEISELLRDMGASLPQTLKDAAEKAMASRGDQWAAVLLESRRVMEKRMARLEKIMVVSGAVSAILLAAVLILYR